MQVMKKLTPIVLILGMPVLMQYLEYRGFFANAEGYALNVYQRGTWHNEASPRIITIGITQHESELFFGGASPLAPNAVRALVAKIQALGPAVVGVDLITDKERFPNYEETEPQRPWPSDRSKNALPSTSPIVWVAGAERPEVERARFILRLFDQEHDLVFARPRSVLSRDPSSPGSGLGFDWGLAVYMYDEDGVVRRLPRQWYVQDDLAFENTFARQVARAYCRPTPDRSRPDTACMSDDSNYEAILLFDRDALDGNHYSVRDLFECAPDHSNVCTDWTFHGRDLRGDPIEWENTVVLLGGDYPDMNDWHRTPIGERTRGLYVNAAAIRTELSSLKLVRSSHFFSLLLDVAVGLLIVVLLKRPKGGTLSRRLAHCCLLGVVASFAGWALFEFGHILWVGWVGMVMTGLAWHIVLDVMRHDSPHDRHGQPVRT
jgi:CHASE2 domain-containing sensor protein